MPIPGRLATLSIIDSDGVEHRLGSPVRFGDESAVDEYDAHLADLERDDGLDLHFVVVRFTYRPRTFWPDEMQARRRVRRRERKAEKVRRRGMKFGRVNVDAPLSISIDTIEAP